MDFSKPHTIFDQNATWKAKTLTDFTAKELLVPIFKDGESCMNRQRLKILQNTAKTKSDFFGTR